MLNFYSLFFFNIIRMKNNLRSNVDIFLGFFFLVYFCIIIRVNKKIIFLFFIVMYFRFSIKVVFYLIKLIIVYGLKLNRSKIIF